MSATATSESETGLTVVDEFDPAFTHARIRLHRQPGLDDPDFGRGERYHVLNLGLDGDGCVVVSPPPVDRDAAAAANGMGC